MKPSTSTLLPLITLSIIFLSLPSLLSASATSLPTDADFVRQICRRTPRPGICMRILNADPRSKDADVTGLALIMVDNLKAESINTLNKINELLRAPRGDKKALANCQQSYQALLDTFIPEAYEALKTGNAKFAEDGANDGAIMADNCESNFKTKSPINHMNNVVRAVSNVARAIIRNLL